MIKNFAKKVLSFFRNVFALIGFSSFVLFLSFTIALSQCKSDLSQPLRIADIHKNANIEDSIVSFDLDGVIQGRSMDPRDEFFAEIFGGPSAYQLSDLRKALRRAGEDIRVRAVYINLRNVQASLTTIQELRRSLVEFRKTEKPLYINVYSGDTLSYFLASAAEKINLSPLGGLMVPGPVFQLTYFGPALEKLGVKMEVFKAGKYKSAFEPFVDSKPSEASLTMYRSMEASLRTGLVKAIADSRKKSESEVNHWLKVSSFSSAEALDKGLIDLVGYEDEFKNQLKELARSENLVKWRGYLHHSSDLDEPRVAKSDAKVGYIEASGEIRMNAARGDERVIAPRSLVKELEWMGEQEDVKAVVLRIDSPGGSALASDIIWESVRKLSEKKPLVVSMGQVAASGGYYMAAPAQKIFAEAQTITGSIGVIGASLVGKELDDKYGVHFHVVTQSDRAKYLDFSQSASEEDQRVISASIDEVYQTFISKVALGRNKTKEQIHEIAQGRVYTGLEAIDVGLVDHIGGRREAFRMAKVLGELNPEKLYPVKQYQAAPKSIMDCVGQRENMVECIQEIETAFRLHLQERSPLGDSMNKLGSIKAMIEEDGMLMYWPGQINWSKRGTAL